MFSVICSKIFLFFQHFVLIEERRLAHAHHAIADSSTDKSGSNDVLNNNILEMPELTVETLTPETINIAPQPDINAQVLNARYRRRLSTTASGSFDIESLRRKRTTSVASYNIDAGKAQTGARKPITEYCCLGYKFPVKSFSIAQQCPNCVQMMFTGAVEAISRYWAKLCLLQVKLHYALWPILWGGSNDTRQASGAHAAGHGNG